jgi:hypothetical protein
MATIWKTISVRVERPPEAPLAEFLADMRSWLDHQCIVPAEFRGVTLANKSGVFDVLFDNPREALLFGRRFGAQPIRSVPMRGAARRSVSAPKSAVGQASASILPTIADSIRSALRMRAKAYQRA